MMLVRLLFLVVTIDGFIFIRTPARFTGPIVRSLTKSNVVLDENLLASARQLLDWETMEAQAAAPVLTLSKETNTLTLAEGYEEQPVTQEACTSANDEPWATGDNWAETLSGLKFLGVIDDDGKELLATAPQLIRLNSSSVLDAACFTVDSDVGAASLIAEPVLLTYTATHLRMGLKFLQTMMGGISETAAMAACASTPKLFVAAVQGALQERAVVDALGAASSATARATETTVGSVSAAYFLKKNRPGRIR
mmetsp:Transcript_82188/g.160419  ORF Transcript_82188/g.160419 Transcript_82188/m.160419 type:complete len:252 (+) Transcript_82188:166-921(+)